jgi:hypothetical protein
MMADLTKLVERLSEMGVELSAPQNELLQRAQTGDYPDDSAGRYEKAMDEVRAKAMLAAGLKVRQDKADQKLLEQLGKKGFARHQKQRAKERESVRKSSLTNRLNCAVEKFSLWVKKWLQACV